MNTKVTLSAKETKKLAADLLTFLEGRNLLCLYGDLGSGKTTFSQGIGEALGIQKRMISPTFVILRKYEVQSMKNKNIANLFHVDLYRIGFPDEIIDVGILDFIRNPENLVIIEWAEKMGEYLPEKRIDVRFEYVDEEKRKISIIQV
ncbi:MAG: tRNA (adenosine(37)-N6)-threonylcarbamoyltransferase complex ATPase subunit type 1 TsaE [Candidatus Levybacteria bacterium]|nr:tRNA (adenosine(37)-N6)-threonylcarbamoyltransferase complex ATPase subunit type 1 TsaE [Candidatus Levybacteria bacterium]